MWQPVSVVVPSYNRAHLIERSMQSIYDQTYRPIRLIVVDNNSTDKSRQIIKNWANRHNSDDFRISLLNEPRQGASNARNKGLDAVATDWVFFFDSDDVMLPDLISCVMEKATTDSSLDLIYWRTAFITSDGIVHPHRFSTHHLLRRHIFNALLSTQAFAVKTEFIRKSGGWNAELPCWNDLELGLRLLTNNPTVASINSILVNIYPQEESITGKDYGSNAGNWEKALEAMETYVATLPPPLRKRLMRYLSYRRINLAALYAREGAVSLASKLKKSTIEACRQRGALTYLPYWRRLLLKAIFQYTRRGGRAAYLVWR